MSVAADMAGHVRRGLALLALRSKGRLFRKYAALLVALVGSALTISAAIETYYSYLENREGLVAIQREKAIGAANVIEQFVKEIEGQVGWTTHASFVSGQNGAEQRRFDFLRLLRQAPAITEVSYIDPAGREQLKVSRLSMDVVGSNVDRSAEAHFIQAKAKRRHVSEVYFRKESEPYLTLSVAGSGRNSGVTVAEVNLKFIWDVVSRLKVGKAGAAYVIDNRGLLIAHPDIGLVLRKTDLSKLGHVAAARALKPAAGTGVAFPNVALDPQGREVLTAFAPVESLGWNVFVDLPKVEAFEPLYASMLRSGLVLLGGLGLAGLAGLWLAQRMVVPIRALAEGAAKIGAGDLDHRLSLKTGDEVETLADGFNRMGARLKESYQGLERKVEERTRELQESLEYQTATSDVLNVISRSPSDVQPVLDAIVQTAARLCAADYAFIARADGNKCHLAAGNKMETQHIQYFAQHPVNIDRGSITGRVALERKTTHVPDVLADPEFVHADWQAVGKQRSVLGVPLLRDDALIGVIILAKTTVAPFDERQIELVTTFADQAVIAIENTRLFEEVQARTKELQESLEYQTATSDVLSVISRSPSQIQPVLDAIVRTAADLCDGFDATLMLRQGDDLKVGAHEGSIPLDFEVKAIGRDWITGRAVVERRAVHVHDFALAAEEFPEGFELHRRQGHRTGLAIPLLREGQAIGAFMIRRMEVSPFSDKQVAVLQTFADQAVIAIENARLFEEVQTRTRELAKSVGELEALGEVGRAVSSTLDLETVLATVVSEATHLGAADGCAIFRYRESDRIFRLWQASGLEEELEEKVRGLKLSAEGTLMAQTIETREVVQVANIAAGPDNPLRTLAISAGFKSALFVPLVRGDRAFGVLVMQRRQEGLFDASIVSLLKTFASQSALAIQNARLFREIEEKGRQLEIASKHKSQFLANMSHELRTPLNAVLGYTELIQDGVYGDMPPKVNAVLDRVQSNGRHLLGLINDVLDLSKIEAGQLELKIDNYSMKEVVQTVVAATEPLASTKKLPIRIDVNGKLPTGLGDERRISQVLLNLLGNAIKFTDSGEIRIAAGVENNRFSVSVIDTGPGIPPSEQAKIFEEFHQVDSSNTKAKGGTGLGLAISRRIVEMHGGSLSVQSVVGTGSTFTLQLPVRVEEQVGAP